MFGPEDDSGHEPRRRGLGPLFPGGGDQPRWRAVPALVALAVVFALALDSGVLPALALVVYVVMAQGYGHLRAARVAGVTLPGVPVPFLGGVTSGVGGTLSVAARLRVALGGPALSAAFCLVAFLLAWAFDTGGLARRTLQLWAMIGFITLLPLFPLTGGRIVFLTASAAGPFVGLVVAGFGVAVTAAVAFATDGLLALAAAFIGALEFSREYATRNGPPEGTPAGASPAPLRLSRRDAVMGTLCWLALLGLHFAFLLAGHFSANLEAVLTTGAAL